MLTHLCTYGCVNDKSEVERRMTHLAQLLKHLKGEGSQQTVTEILNFTSKNLILTHQRLDFPNALEKVRLRFCHMVLMNLYLGGFQCVHSFSKHRRKYAGHVSEKRKRWRERILSLTIVGVLLGRICCLFVLTGFPGPANTPSNQNHFQLPIFLDRPQNKT